MTYDEIDYTIRALRHKLCQTCLGEDNASYRKMCRRKGDLYDCKPQALLDKLEDEFLKKTSS